MSTELTKSILDQIDSFTSALKTKLLGIDPGAQVNPDNVVKVSMIDSNVASLAAGSIAWSLNGSQLTEGADKITDADQIDISTSGATFGSDPSSPDVSLTSVNLSSYFNNRLNKGGLIVLAFQLRGNTGFVYCQAGTIAARNGGWTLTDLTWYGTQSLSAAGSKWNVVCGSGIEFSKDIVDFIAGIEAAFHPKTSDFWQLVITDFAHWAGTDVTGDVSFFTGSPSGTTIISGANAFDWSTVTNIRLAAKAWPTQNYLSADLANLTIPTPSVGTKYVVHKDQPYDKSSYATMTVTAVTAVGTGNAKYYNLTVTTVQTGDNFDFGNNLFLRFTDEPPSDVTVPSANVELDDSFIHRIHTLENYPASLFGRITSKLTENPVSNYVTAFLTALQMKLNDWYARLDGSNVSGISVKDVAKVIIQNASNTLGNISLGTLLSRYVQKGELIGDDTADFYSQYQALTALLDTQTTNKRGAWGIGTNESGAPSDTDTTDQNQIGDGNYTLVLGAIQQNSDWSFRSAYAASDFESGDILYAHPYDPYDKDNYYKMTLTSNATLVGTGNAAYLYMAVTIDEVGSVVDLSDGWRITETPPTSLLAGLRGRLPASGQPILSQATNLLTGLFQKVSLARLGKHIRPDTTEPTDIPSVFESTNSLIKNGNNLIGILNPLSDGIAQIKWGLGATVNDDDGNSISESDIADRLNVHHDITISAGNVFIKGTVNNFSKNTLPNDTHYLINLMDATQSGTFSDGASVTIQISSNLVGREEFVDDVMKSESPNIAGKGGKVGDIWTRGTNDDNADWGGRDVTVSDTAPANPTEGQVWIDTSGSTAILKVREGSAWKQPSAYSEETLWEGSQSFPSTSTNYDLAVGKTFTGYNAIAFQYGYYNQIEWRVFFEFATNSGLNKFYTTETQIRIANIKYVDSNTFSLNSTNVNQNLYKIIGINF